MALSINIPFNRPYVARDTNLLIQNVFERGHLCGDGYYTKLCEEYLQNLVGAPKALLTQSCTDALEMCAILLDLKEGDEVIMPSYTFVSTANCVELRGAKPVFVDIDPKTMNIDPASVKTAINANTKAIFVVHYAGIPCEITSIEKIARENGLYLVEDAAHAIGSKHLDRAIGSFGDLATFSFHETKNVSSGEGGALIINNENFIDRAEIIREKGTNRKSFFRGEVDKYSWVDIGSSYLPSEITAACLFAQLQDLDIINKSRTDMWNLYHNWFESKLDKYDLALPHVNSQMKYNGHIYFVMLDCEQTRSKLISDLKLNSVSAVFHYLPLHKSPFYEKKYGNTTLQYTEDASQRLLRLPLWSGLHEHSDYLFKKLEKSFDNIAAIT